MVLSQNLDLIRPLRLDIVAVSLRICILTSHSSAPSLVLLATNGGSVYLQVKEEALAAPVVSSAPVVPTVAVGRAATEPTQEPLRVPADHIDHWGYFTIAFLQPTLLKEHGSVEARCPYHALGSKSRCKKYFKLRESSESHRIRILWAMRHWCNTASTCNRQRQHLGNRQLQTSNLPEPLEIERCKILVPPQRVLTDAELDAGQELEARALPKSKAKAKPRATARV